MKRVRVGLPQRAAKNQEPSCCQFNSIDSSICTITFPENPNIAGDATWNNALPVFALYTPYHHYKNFFMKHSSALPKFSKPSVTTNHIVKQSFLKRMVVHCLMVGLFVGMGKGRLGAENNFFAGDGSQLTDPKWGTCSRAFRIFVYERKYCQLCNSWRNCERSKWYCNWRHKLH